jgi:hypothetical protein
MTQGGPYLVATPRSHAHGKRHAGFVAGFLGSRPLDLMICGILSRTSLPWRESRAKRLATLRRPSLQGQMMAESLRRVAFAQST